jgi:hypothetical protein
MRWSFRNLLVSPNFANIAGQVAHAGNDTIIDLHPIGFDVKITLAGFTGTISDSNVWFA